MLKCQDDLMRMKILQLKYGYNALIRMQLRSEPGNTTFKKRMFRNKTYSH